MPIECQRARDAHAMGSYRPRDNSIARSYVAFGNFTMQMDFYRDSGYAARVTNFPLYVNMGEDIFVDVSLKSPDTDLKIVLSDCDARPFRTDTRGAVYHQLISNKCSQDSTTRILSSPVMNSHFAFSAFEFVASFDEVYIYCFVKVCNTTDTVPDCDRMCQGPAGRSISKRSISDKQQLVLGPIITRRAEPEKSKNPFAFTTAAIVMGVAATAMVVAAVSMFAMRKKNH